MNRRPFQKYESYTPLNTDRAEILRHVKDSGVLQSPYPMKPNPRRMKSKDHCAFHNNVGHQTNKCISLKDAIEDAIGKGMLKHYVSDEKGEMGRDEARASSPVKSRDKQPIKGTIHVIEGIAEEWMQSHSKRKAYLRSIMTVNPAFKRPKMSQNWETNFNQEDEENVLDEEGNDPLIVKAVIEDFVVERILVDSGSAVDVLHWKAFQKLGFKEGALKKTAPIYGFSNQPISVKGSITLSVTLGDGENTTRERVEFVIVDQPSAYNAIFGRPLMRTAKLVIATFCMKVKFPTPTGMGFMNCDQASARKCRIAAIAMMDEGKQEENRPQLSLPLLDALDQETEGRQVCELSRNPGRTLVPDTRPKGSIAKIGFVNPFQEAKLSEGVIEEITKTVEDLNPEEVPVPLARYETFCELKKKLSSVRCALRVGAGRFFGFLASIRRTVS